MSDLSSCNESTFIESKDEYLSNNCDGSIDYRKLHVQNEKYRQELHELQLKLAYNEAMQRELQEANELLEQMLTKEKEKAEKKLQEVQEKNRQVQEEYKTQLNDLGTELENKEKENKELHNLLTKYKAEVSQTNSCKSDNIEEKLIPLKQQVEELLIEVEDEKKKKEETEKINRDLNNQLAELQEILQITRNNLRENKEMLENTHEKLALCRIEIETLKTVPASESCKGNSLFAEVEDRRQVVLNKAVTLRKKYDELKRAYNTKAEEVKLLKKEKVVILKKLDNYVNAFSEDDDIVNKYKNKIYELEKKLAKAQKDSIETKGDDTSFSYLESLLAEKKKEIQKLHQKIERNSIDMLFQTETKNKITKQLQYWQFKAMHMEAQLSAIKSQLELEHPNSSEHKSFFEAVEKHKVIYEECPDEKDSEIQNISKSEKIISELIKLKDGSSVSCVIPNNILQTTTNVETSSQDINTEETDESQVTNKNCLDYSKSGKSEFEITKLEENKNEMRYKEIEKSQQHVHFSEDTKSPTSDSTIKRKQNEEKKKVKQQYKVLYISSELSK